ncbi:hypothetical protein [Cecembia rubra]|uniref:Uncharacterized protein n=1 Tax=Cecembia rubra TaxID=1485585 RepID=A0A2P8E0G2_9BACT|nr:hypothetical protein [Cecembia rubra]PSL02948.1 hypothetical protein CLV48_10857 [Cecembia rubra]
MKFKYYLLALFSLFIQFSAYSLSLSTSLKDTIVIVVNRKDLNTETSFRKRTFGVENALPKTEMRIYRDKFSNPNYYLALVHTPFYNHITIYFSLLELGKYKVIWDKNLSYQDWANLSSEGDKNIYLMVFEDELMHRDRFCHGFQVKAYQVAIHTGAQE